MTDDDSTVPDRAVEELAFLARSRHRIQLLGQLSVEERTRRDLRDATGISKPTMGRILGDFEERRWIANNHDGTYKLTPQGVLVADGLDDLLGVLDTVGRLADVAGQLPLERMAFDPRHLSSATIVTPSSADPLAHMRRFDELAAHATRVEMFSNVLSCTPAHEPSDADRELLAQVDELIVTADALRSDLEDPGLSEWLQGRVEDGDLTLHQYDGSADYLYGMFDDTVGIVPIDDGGMPSALIETEADPIRSWARDTFEAHRRTATELAPDASPA